MQDLICIDTETHLFAPGNMAPKVVCLSWATPDGKSGLVHHTEIEEWFDHRVLGDNLAIIGHNIAYDTKCLSASYPALLQPILELYDHDKVYCTQAREKLLNIASGQNDVWFSPDGKAHKTDYHLANLAMRYLNMELDKSEDGYRMRYQELEHLPLKEWPPRAIAYAINDAISTLGVFTAQRARAREMIYAMPTQALESKAGFALDLMSTWGIHCDPKNLIEILPGITEEIKEIRAELIQAKILRPKTAKAAREFNAGNRSIEWAKNTKLVKDLIVASYPGIVPVTDKGNIKTDISVIKECTDERLKVLNRYDKMLKLRKNYLSKMAAGIKKPVHSRFHVLGCLTSRTSSSGPNLQNQPKYPGIRECFVARPGYYFVGCDFNSHEVRTLAQTCYDLFGFSRLRDEYLKDRKYDPHLEFAATLLRTPLEEIKERHAADDEVVVKKRQNAKIAIFGFPGGLGAAGLVRHAKGFGVTLTLDEAYELKDAYFEHLPEMVMYFDLIKTTIGQKTKPRIPNPPPDYYQGDFVIPQSGFKRANCGYTNAANNYFQALAAHGMKLALWEVTKRCYSDTVLKGCRPVAVIHDELIMEVPCDRVHEAAKELESIMVTSMEIYTPDVPAAAEAFAMKHWTKSAKPKYVDGKLVPWDI